MKHLLVLFALCIFTLSHAQNENAMLPYHEIPEYPETYTAQNVLSRMIDGLGYRYYWATEGLRQEDLDYAPPGEDTRTCKETLHHMHNLARTTLLGIKNEANFRNNNDSLSYEELREGTLRQLLEASLFLREMEEDLSESNIIFSRGENESRFPIWNLVNGPIADAIYHTGQLVSFRRSSGNPIDPMVNVFRGKNRSPKKE